MNKVVAKINMLSTLTATNRSFKLMNECLAISINGCRARLFETKVSKKLVKEDNLLN